MKSDGKMSIEMNLHIGREWFAPAQAIQLSSFPQNPSNR
jgi:hypothetical protein